MICSLFSDLENGRWWISSKLSKTVATCSTQANEGYGRQPNRRCVTNLTGSRPSEDNTQQQHRHTFVALVPVHEASHLFAHRSYAQLFHVPCVDAWALPCLAMADCVQRRCTELLHALSLIFPEVSLINTEDSFSPLFKAILYAVSLGRKVVSCRRVP